MKLVKVNDKLWINADAITCVNVYNRHTFNDGGSSEIEILHIEYLNSNASTQVDLTGEDAELFRVFLNQYTEWACNAIAQVQ